MTRALVVVSIFSLLHEFVGSFQYSTRFGGRSQRSNRLSEVFSSRSRDSGLAFTSVVSNPRDVPGPQNVPSRTQQLRNLQEKSIFDVLVVGGGVTGSGIALDAVSRGLTVACIERGDFSSETSSRSTKLIWAGLKYIATAVAALLSPNLMQHPMETIHEFIGEMKMVLHCHRERRWMMERQSHLIHWLPIAIPFDRWIVDPPPLGHPLFSLFPLLAPLVLKFYDSLSLFTCPPSYILTKEQALKEFPQLDDENLKYCAVFYEGHHNDARTNLALALTAAEKGANICNYVEMTQILINESTGKAIGIVALDRMTGKRFQIFANKIVLAGGPFTDDLLEDGDSQKARRRQPIVEAAYGTHIVLPGHFLPKNMGLLDYNTSDGRFLFIAPWQGHTLVGTTDKKGQAATLNEPPEEDILWLMNEAQKYLRKDLTIDRSDILSAWRGWRPLVSDPNAQTGTHKSRDHVISESPKSGVVFVAGGKWTTYREMAQDTVDRLLSGNGPQSLTDQITLYGGEGYADDLGAKLMMRYSIDSQIAHHFAETYGGRAWEVCALVPSLLNQRLAEGYPYIIAEIIFACREYACTIEDVLSRRTRLAFLNKDAAITAIPLVADVMARELGWTSSVKNDQVEAALRYIFSYGGKEPLQKRAPLPKLL